MKNELKEGFSVGAFIIGVIFVVLAFVGAATWLFRGSSLLQNTFFAPKEEVLRREVFETSKAYRDGAAQELMALRVEYEKSPSHALRSLILHKSAGVPRDALPGSLQLFIAKLEDSQ